MSKTVSISLTLASLALVNVSCSVSTPAPGSQYAIEELVLIEFAARLEEDYHRLHPGNTGASTSSRTVPTETSVDVDSGEHESVKEPVQYEPANSPHDP
jgi:hypothetical protein